MTVKMVNEIILSCDRCGKTIVSGPGSKNRTGFRAQHRLVWSWSVYGEVPEGQLSLPTETQKTICRDFCDECSGAVQEILAPLLRSHGVAGATILTTPTTYTIPPEEQ